MGRVLALAVVLAAAMACTAPPPPVPPGLVFPRHTLGVGDAMPEALLEGVLREERGCLWLEAETTDVVARTLALWPPSWGAVRLDDGSIGVVDDAGRVVAQVERPIRASGGMIEQGAPAVDQAAVAEASKCSGGPWWLVGAVTQQP